MFWNGRTSSVRNRYVSHSKSIRWSLLAAIVLALAAGGRATAQTASSHQVNPILSDGYTSAPVVDSNFVDTWGFNRHLLDQHQCEGSLLCERHKWCC